jgi:guanylate kinase
MAKCNSNSPWCISFENGFCKLDSKDPCAFKVPTNDVIICLVGESGAGKTTIAKMLGQLGYNAIQSYTTRPRRFPKEWGHVFVSESEWLKAEKAEIAGANNVLAPNKIGDYHYWGYRQQYQGRGISIYAVDPAGVKLLRTSINDAEIIVIFLKADLDTRTNRMYEEGRSIQDVSERITLDRKTFSITSCNWVIDANGSLEQTLDLIQLIIKGITGE